MSSIDPKTAPNVRGWFAGALASAAEAHVNGLHFLGWPADVATGPAEITPPEREQETTDGGW